MKKTIKLAFAAFAFAAFTACTTDNNQTETDAMDATEGIETDMETDMNMDAGMDTDTTILEDTTVNDGVVDDIQEEQPPVQ